MALFTHTLGYPRIGGHRELKKAVEGYWSGKLSQAELEEAGQVIRAKNWKTQAEVGIALPSSNDFSFYDHVLDLSCLLGVIPSRFEWKREQVGLDLRFAIARGKAAEQEHCCGAVHASDMTKWFDTNYHYLVPEFGAETAFGIFDSKIFDEFREAKVLGIVTKPMLVGPVTYLCLGKIIGDGVDRKELLTRLLPVYAEILRRLTELGAEWVQLDEPIFTQALGDEERRMLEESYAFLRRECPGVKILVATYFGELKENLKTALALPVDAFHFDAVRGRAELPALLGSFPKDKILSLGVVDGRGIWKNDFAQTLKLIKDAIAKLGAGRVWIAPSCSLLHTPVSVRHEKQLDATVRDWLAFGEEKLHEVSTLAALASGENRADALEANCVSIVARRNSPRIHKPEVKARCSAVHAEDLQRKSAFPARQAKQHAKLNLPLLPTTTIGSFPQTKEVRSWRAQWKKGDLSTEDYENRIKREIEAAIRIQEELDIDMPVHGEFERNDMVEYFGELLEGFAFTQNGWVQSYGSRCVKPPILFGDVQRPEPMTVRWSAFAQSLTKRPMKGMLTGPITILQWSFVRDDQPREETAKQIALAIRDEVQDLESAGIAAIQIDEPAIREGLPLHRSEGAAYLRWAVDAFRLSSAGVRDETQIHTHMCYSEFNDIIDSIAAMDADVITIETARSNMELLHAFVKFRYPNEIGPGVYDIHSPVIPSVEEMEALLRKALEVIPKERLWVNPDCGLKTRGWKETLPALQNMVTAAKRVRAD